MVGLMPAHWRSWTQPPEPCARHRCGESGRSGEDPRCQGTKPSTESGANPCGTFISIVWGLRTTSNRSSGPVAGSRRVSPAWWGRRWQVPGAIGRMSRPTRPRTRRAPWPLVRRRHPAAPSQRWFRARHLRQHARRSPWAAILAGHVRGSSSRAGSPNQGSVGRVARPCRSPRASR